MRLRNCGRPCGRATTHGRLVPDDFALEEAKIVLKGLAATGEMPLRHAAAECSAKTIGIEESPFQVFA